MTKTLKMQRTIKNESQFKAQCRKQLRDKGLEIWADMIDRELAKSDGYCAIRKEDGHTIEIVSNKIGHVQIYLKDAYNFIYEYDQYDECTGFGYLFVTE